MTEALVGSTRTIDGLTEELVSRWWNADTMEWVEYWLPPIKERVRLNQEIIKQATQGDKRPISYGQEVILDLHGCDRSLFTKKKITVYFKQLCDLLGMERQDLHFWEFETPSARFIAPVHLAGISAVQFITTSNITLHTVDKLKALYINVFSCNSFDAILVRDFSARFFAAREVEHNSFYRGYGVYNER